jgi:malonyl-CoA/methylmalonyl-CoA synthetase
MTIDLQPVAFPNEPHFERLIQHCLESPDQVALYDDAMGIVASYEQLLRDIEATRRSLVNSLPQSIVDIKQGIMSKDQTLFVAILAPGNYEFLVAALAVLATGAALVPFGECFELEIHLNSVN